jgi:Tfp pilus assembly pilus retraction ATPase PilT
MGLHSLLEEMMAKGASDLHIVARISAVFRIDEDLKVLGEKPLTPEGVNTHPKSLKSHLTGIKLKQQSYWEYIEIPCGEK